MERKEIRVLNTYTVHIGYGLLGEVGKHASRAVKPGKALMVTDDNIPSDYITQAENSLLAEGFEVFKFVIPAGERSKCAQKYIELQNYAAQCRLCRSDIMLALGGGVVGDLTGFAAATYMRGIKYIQIPTTLLAAVDSSVGGKTAIDLEVGKNLVGAFCQPSAVICDISTLKTLRDEVFRDGMAEVIKYAHLREPELFRILEECENLAQSIKNGTEREIVTDIIARCVQLKADIVNADQFDTGERQLLNFGHTAGHAIEAVSNFSISHGHAVAMGMCIFARAAAKEGICTPEISERISALNKKYGLPTETDYDPELLYDAALSDKKNVGNGLTVVLPEKHALCGLHKISHEKLHELLISGTEK